MKKASDYSSVKTPHAGTHNSPTHEHTAGKLTSITIYLIVFFALYAFLAKSFVAPYILIDTSGVAMTFGFSGTVCWLSFTAALLAGFPWAKRSNIPLALASAILSAPAAAGFCVLGYALLASPVVALVLIALGILVLLIAIRVLNLVISAAAEMTIAAPMYASLALFALLSAGSFSLAGISDSDGAEATLGELKQLVSEESTALGVDDASIVVRPLPKSETARYDHESNEIILNAASLMGYSSREELAAGTLHALAHQSQAIWPDLNLETVNAWLEETNGACSPDESEEAYRSIEEQARDYTQKSSLSMIESDT